MKHKLIIPAILFCFASSVFANESIASPITEELAIQMAELEQTALMEYMAELAQSKKGSTLVVGNLVRISDEIMMPVRINVDIGQFKVPMQDFIDNEREIAKACQLSRKIEGGGVIGINCRGLDEPAGSEISLQFILIEKNKISFSHMKDTKMAERFKHSTLWKEANVVHFFELKEAE